MKSLCYIVVAFAVCMAARAQQVPTSPIKIQADKNYSAIRINGNTNQSDVYVRVTDGTKTVFTVNTNGSIGITPTNGAIVFSGTTTAATATNIVGWVGVSVSGDTNLYRLPLYK